MSFLRRLFRTLGFQSRVSTDVSPVSENLQNNPSVAAAKKIPTINQLSLPDIKELVEQNILYEDFKNLQPPLEKINLQLDMGSLGDSEEIVINNIANKSQIQLTNIPKAAKKLTLGGDIQDTFLMTGEHWFSEIRISNKARLNLGRIKNTSRLVVGLDSEIKPNKYSQKESGQFQKPLKIHENFHKMKIFDPIKALVPVRAFAPFWMVPNNLEVDVHGDSEHDTDGENNGVTEVEGGSVDQIRVLGGQLHITKDELKVSGIDGEHGIIVSNNALIQVGTNAQPARLVSDRYQSSSSNSGPFNLSISEGSLIYGVENDLDTEIPKPRWLAGDEDDMLIKRKPDPVPVPVPE